jgi:mannobiose 2-epimerase
MTMKDAHLNAMVLSGLSEHYRATGDDLSLQRAISLWEAIEEHLYDTKYGGYLGYAQPNWDLPFRIPEDPIKFADDHVRILEAYVNLHRSWKDAKLQERIYGVIDVLVNHFLRASTWHTLLGTGETWMMPDSTVSYGRDIELAWQLLDAAHELENETLLEQVKDIAIHLVDVQVKEGLNKDGALASGPERDNLDWWVQAEALNAFFKLYEVTKNEKYLERAQVLWTWVNKNLVDHEYGEWFRTVTANGTVEKTLYKIDSEKGPYHNVRMEIFAFERIGPRSDLGR